MAEFPCKQKKGAVTRDSCCPSRTKRGHIYPHTSSTAAGNLLEDTVMDGLLHTSSAVYNPSATSRCGSLLRSLSADVRSSDDVIAFVGVLLLAPLTTPFVSSDPRSCSFTMPTSRNSAAAFRVRSVSIDSEFCDGACFGTHLLQKTSSSPKSEICFPKRGRGGEKERKEGKRDFYKRWNAKSIVVDRS